MFMLPQWLPASFGGRAVAFVPDNVRRARNAAFWAVFLQLTVDLVSIGFGGARGGLATASAAIHGVLAIVAALQLLALLRLMPLLLLFGSVLSTGIPAVFALFLVLMVTVGQGGSNPSDGILAVIFISLLLDFIAGLLCFWAFVRLHLYARNCKREEDEFMAAMVADLRAAATTSGTPTGSSVPATGNAVVVSVAPASQGPPVAPVAPAPWSERSRGLQTLQDAHGAVLPPNAGTAVMPLLPTAAVAPDPTAASVTSGSGATAAAASGRRGGGPSLLRGGVVGRAAASAAAGAAAASAATAEPAPAPVPPVQAECDICVTRPRNTAFYPCGHMACAACAAQVRARAGNCHLCRRPIRDTMRIYMD